MLCFEGLFIWCLLFLWRRRKATSHQSTSFAAFNFAAIQQVTSVAFLFAEGFETNIDELVGSSLIAPDVIRISFMAQPGNRLHLNMTRNRNVRTDIPVFLGTERGGMREWENARTMQVTNWFLYQVNVENMLRSLNVNG